MTIHASVSRDVPELSAELRDQFDTALTTAAARRERQLAELPPTHGDLVAAAHRESVTRILSEIRAAQERLATGRFGRCEGCAAAIPAERLDLRPWTTLCVACAPRA
ncbi:TraR/DksA family transcriptional regulator [Nocardioides sp.]|uniref:TraR/DksA family transcriptional regulator n=1 Tax=Nocardioides sp. TaxID=35761 RepID=UPI002ED249AB